MKAKELVKYIMSKMSAEQALLILIESSIIQYENLKFDKGKEVHPVLIISMAALDMGWNMVVEKDTESVEGLIVGTKEYIERNLKSKK
jgi:hypothetical protein